MATFNATENSIISAEEATFLESIGVTLNPPAQQQQLAEKVIAQVMDIPAEMQEDLPIENDRPSGWHPLEEADIIEMFGNFLNYDEPSIDIANFDFRTHTADWYKEKWPNFPDEFYNILEEASRVKIDDKRKPTFTKIEKETTLKFD